MKSLTKIWFKYKPLRCQKNNCIITHRLFLEKLECAEDNGGVLYIAINTLSGAIDLLNQIEAEALSSAINNNDFKVLPDSLFRFLVKRAYIFRSKEIKELVFDTF